MGQNMHDAGETGLKIENLAHRYEKMVALDDVSFVAEKGRFTHLLSPNGAEKSTFFALLMQLFVAPAGKITIAGMDLATQTRRTLAQIGVVFQKLTLDLDLTVSQNLSYYVALRRLSGRDAKRRMARALEILGMAERAQERARNLNGGHRRRTKITPALLHDPRVLLRGEATVGLDAVSRAGIVARVHDLFANTDLKAPWATDLVNELWLDDALIILHRGRIPRRGSAKHFAAGTQLEPTLLALTRRPI